MHTILNLTIKNFPLQTIYPQTTSPLSSNYLFLITKSKTQNFSTSFLYKCWAPYSSNLPMNSENAWNLVGRGVWGVSGPDKRRSSRNERAENRGPAIRCLEERKGEACGGGGGGGRHRERWKRSLEDGPRRRCTHREGEAKEEATRCAQVRQSRRDHVGRWRWRWVVFEKEEARIVARI